MNILGNKIKELRKSLGMSQAELAFKVGYSGRSTIHSVESGRTDLQIDKIVKFAEALGTTPEYLMGWEEEKPPAEISVEAVTNYLIRAGYIEPDDDLSDEDLRFISMQLESIAVWFKNKKESRK